MDKYSKLCTFLEALSIRASIPVTWKRAISKNWQQSPMPPTTEIKLDDRHPKDINTLTTKKMYDRIIAQRERKNAAKEKWYRGEDGIKISDHIEWSSTCLRVYISTRETKLQSFQVKLLHRILPCGTYLKQIRINTSDKCTICNQKDSLAHFFSECENVAAFWKQLDNWFNRVEDIPMDKLTAKEHMFGYPRKPTKVEQSIASFSIPDTTFTGKDCSLTANWSCYNGYKNLGPIFGWKGGYAKRPGKNRNSPTGRRSYQHSAENRQGGMCAHPYPPIQPDETHTKQTFWIERAVMKSQPTLWNHVT